MPKFDQEEFKFPDEVEDVAEDSGSDNVEIEVEDDTPEEDRGKTPLPKPLVEELDKDELEAYDGKTKERLKQMRKVWHDERREKEAAQREQQEAINVARRLLEENKRMRGMISSGGQDYVNTMQHAATLELEAAKRSYKEAYEAGDADRVVAAQEAMQMASLKLVQAKNYKLPSLQEEESEVQLPQPQEKQPVARPDDKALAWQERNEWFGDDDEMTAAALGLHAKLQRNGVVVGSDEYYATLDKTMRKRFPEYFGAEVSDEQTKPERTKRPTVVAPAARSTSPNKIRLKASQVQLAKKLGLTNEQYAREVLKLESHNG